MIQTARYIEASLAIDNWDDAEIEGACIADFPLRAGDNWRLVIHLDTGKTAGWPLDVTVKTHFKVCVRGEFWLLDENRKRIAKWSHSYVPSAYFDREFDHIVSDYVFLHIQSDGKVADWQRPEGDLDHWLPMISPLQSES